MEKRELFINKSNKIHNFKYDYSLVDYKNSKIKVEIICPEHGLFLQIPNSHLSGRGCPICGNKKIGENQRLTISDFINKSNKIHNFKYDYSKSEYFNNSSKIKIVCLKHGEFEQLPMNHMRGYGCPRCKESKGEILISFLLNKMNIGFERQKRFDDCKNIKPLPFDFYIPTLNLLIEFDGEQHFSEKWNGKNLTKIKENDKIKTEFSKKEGFKLFRISYKDNVEEKLSSLLEELK